MKKVISLLLVLVLCLSLWACGEDSGNPTNQTTIVPTTTPNGTNTAPTNPVPTDPTPTDPAPTDPAPTEPVVSLYQRWIDRMTGTWFTNVEQGKPCETFTVNSDGTIVINGESYTIRITTLETWQWAKLDIYKGDTQVYEMRADLEDNGQISMSFTDPVRVKYFREDQYEVISITKDNWLDYYEFYWEYKPQVNGFGEVESAQCWFGFRLKEAYSSIVNQDCSHVSVELSFSRGTQYGTFSSDRTTFVPDGVYEKWEGADITEVFDLKNTRITNGSSYSIATANFEESCCGSLYPSNETVLRATGTLYLYNGTP